MKPKFVKVSVSERLPEKKGFYIVTDGNEYFETEFINGEFDVTFSLHHWLEEVPDREEEMREMLEELYNLLEENQGEAKFYTQGHHRKIKKLLNELKQTT